MGVRPGARWTLPFEAEADVRVPALSHQRAVTVMRTFIRIVRITTASTVLLPIGFLPGAAEPAGDGDSDSGAGFDLSAGRFFGPQAQVTRIIWTRGESTALRAEPEMPYDH